MAYVIAQPCVGCKDAACVDVCPTGAIHPRRDEPEFELVAMLHIDPDACLEVGPCAEACPVDAIFPAATLPAHWAHLGAASVSWYRARLITGPPMGQNGARAGATSEEAPRD
ncbi:MAG: 4Fe-4S dicluster domain-containing protein [Acidimicrobiales bacterium]